MAAPAPGSQTAPSAPGPRPAPRSGPAPASPASRAVPGSAGRNNGGRGWPSRTSRGKGARRSGNDGIKRPQSFNAVGPKVPSDVACAALDRLPSRGTMEDKRLAFIRLHEGHLERIVLADHYLSQDQLDLLTTEVVGSTPDWVRTMLGQIFAHAMLASRGLS